MAASVGCKLEGKVIPGQHYVVMIASESFAYAFSHVHYAQIDIHLSKAHLLCLNF